jgi:hypothetical protein
MPKIIIIIAYFGKWPEWINLYLESCKYNKFIDWLIITDCEEPENKCESVKYNFMDFEDFKELVKSKLIVDIDPAINSGKKQFSHIMGDLKPFFSSIFEEHIKGYDYWGWGDIDVIYGDMNKYFEEEKVFEKDYELISFNDDRMVSGSLAFIKNSFLLRLKAFQIQDWKDAILHDNRKGLDEHRFYLNLDKSKCYLKDSYNTPSVDGDQCFWKFNWLSKELPTEWYWRKGVLTNNINTKIEFLYFHFMVWKGGFWGKVHNGCQWEKLNKLVHLDYKDIKDGFRINEKGFYKL